MGAPAKPHRVQKVEKAERQQQILALRKNGATYAQIAAQLGKDVAQIYRECKEALADIKAKTNETGEELKTLEVMHLQDLRLKLMNDLQRGKNDDNRGKLNYAAVQSLIRLMDQYAKLIGLYAPTKQEVSGSVGFTWQDVLNELPPDDTE